jgi:hypothetical protein
VRLVLFVMYCVMASWMLVAAVLRVMLSVNNGVPIDALPAITGGIGLFALGSTVPRVIGRVRHRRGPLSGLMVQVPREDSPDRDARPFD